MNEFDADLPRERGGPFPPIFTYILCGLCAQVFLLQMLGGKDSPTGLAYPSYVNGVELLQGKYWGLITSFFLHGDFLHIAFNLYWLYRFGTVTEPYIGWKRFALFWLVGTAASGSVELAFSGTTGIGASGFVYALFGLIWMGGGADGYLARIIDQQTVTVFMVWLFLCMALTWAGTWNIANGAHIGGLAFGALCGYAFIGQGNRGIKTAAAAMTLLFFVPLFYAPWSETWNMAHDLRSYSDGAESEK